MIEILVFLGKLQTRESFEHGHGQFNTENTLI